MEPKYLKIFSKSAESYCKLNNIEDVDGFIKKCFDTGFNIEKYGLLEKPLNEAEKHLIKEIIVEKRVEIPVEVIKEVEKIVEVIKEVPVDRVIEKEIYITDNNQVNELGEKITKLEEEMSKKDKKLDELRHSLDVNLDKTNEKMLEDTLQKLRKELKDKTERIRELEKINQDLQSPKDKLKAIFMRGSNLNDTL
jgi:predicted RNase H-like nuclease (RuvC/YqgF family)